MAQSPLHGHAYQQNCDDKHGHGTSGRYCCGKNNAFGSVGVSAGATVVPVKVIANTGSASFSYLIQGNKPCSEIRQTQWCNLPGHGYISLTEHIKPLIRRSEKPSWILPIWEFGCTWRQEIMQVMPITICRLAWKGTEYLPLEPSPVPAIVWQPQLGQRRSWLGSHGRQRVFHLKNGEYAVIGGTAQAATVVASIIHARSGEPMPGEIVRCGNASAAVFDYQKPFDKNGVCRKIYAKVRSRSRKRKERQKHGKIILLWNLKSLFQSLSYSFSGICTVVFLLRI